jgi:ankyrin repeat protein
MPALNPFLRALFQSSVLGHALPAQNYVVLVPTSESLIYGLDKETGKRYADTCEDEDFLGSHILRIPPGAAKEGSIRDGRGKAKTYPTVNARTVIVKESTVYTNKGFKQLTQAQIHFDILYHSPGNDTQQWLVYFISKPLVGAYDGAPIKPALLVQPKPVEESIESSSQPKKKECKSFNELLNHFPMIARQMQPGLERLFNEFGKELGKPLPPPPSRSSMSDSFDGTTQAYDTGSIKSNGSIKLPFNSAEYFEDEEDLMRKALETAVTAGIDLFQGVDKQQLSLLGATTDLTGPDVEKLIERYIAESVHDTLLFPRLCSFYRTQDQELDRRMKQMDCLDVAQVGIALEDGREGKKDLITRIDSGVTAFRKMGVAGSPQEMLEVLLETQKAVSESGRAANIADEEKRAHQMTINADVLVSMLLLVVIRSQVRHLQARLSYMQRFIYIDDVESGEIGYALSTLEAVVTYLARDAAGLRKASRQNKMLWDAVKSGKIDDVKSILEGANIAVVDSVIEEPEEQIDLRPSLSRTTTTSSHHSHMNGSISRSSSVDGGLSHVFPFQTTDVPKKRKRVQMATRSMSISSSVSHLSRAATIETTLSGIEGDTSVESLAQTQDASGNSVLMMAVESQKPSSLQYMLGLSERFPVEAVLADTSSEGTTLLSAAVQLGNEKLVEVLLSYLTESLDESSFKEYIGRPDSRGRSAGHYIFTIPSLITRLGEMLPWRQKDKIGHTPLFAICRTYDHAEYSTMVSEALTAARAAQQTGEPLRVEDHIDNKGNSLLHIVKDANITHRILSHCDVDVNVMNDKKFTPLMLASKYGRVDMVRILFGDPRVDLYLREFRGLTAVELAKDDEVRNRIDDLTLFSSNATSNEADATGRITAIVRSYFVEDGSTRFVLKSGAPNTAVSSTTYTITTSRRSLQDFENLAKWLLMDHPASYMPNIRADTFRTPFQIHSKPSRAVLHESQVQLDRFLKIMISHPTFAAHEMLWEFFLVPDMAPEQIAERAKLKAELVKERISDDYDPMTTRSDLKDVDSVITHSRDVVRKVSINTRGLIRRGHAYRNAQADLATAVELAATGISTLGPPSTTLPRSHIDAITRFAALMQTEPASSPLSIYTSSLTSFQSTILAVQTSLTRPSNLITQITSAQRSLEKNRNILINNSAPRKGPFNIHLPGAEESRVKSMQDSERKIMEAEVEVDRLGRELRYTQEVVLGELAGWTSWREEWGRQEIKRLVRGSVVKEREKLRGMQRVLRNLKEGR